MIALAFILGALILGAIAYMEWDNRANWFEGRRIESGSREQREKLVVNNPFLRPIMVEAGLL